MQKILDHWEKVIEDPQTYLEELNQRTGRGIVGVFPLYYPMELIWVAGAHPWELWGNAAPITKADAHMQSYACSLSRSNLEAQLDGRLDLLDGVVFARKCDTLQNLATIWENLPDGRLIDVMRFPVNPGSAGAAAFLRSEIIRNRDRLGSLFDAQMSDEDLSETIRLFNRLRRGLRTLLSMRASTPKTVGIRTWYTALRASRIVDREEFLEQLEELLDALGEPDPEPAAPRLLVTGMIPEPVNVLLELEAQGAVVVDDDLGIGMRSVATDASEQGDPVAALVQQYLSRGPCPTLHNDAHDRPAYLVDRAERAGVDGVVFFRLKFCDPEAFDYPDCKEALDKAKIPTLLLETEWQSAQTGALRTRIQAFVETLGSGEAK